MFCGSCHETMSPLVESRAPTGLARCPRRPPRRRLARAGLSTSATALLHLGGHGRQGGRRAAHVSTLTRSYAFPIEAHRFDLDSCLAATPRQSPTAPRRSPRPDVAQALLSGRPAARVSVTPRASRAGALRVCGAPARVDLDAGDAAKWTRPPSDVSAWPGGWRSRRSCALALFVRPTGSSAIAFSFAGTPLIGAAVFIGFLGWARRRRRSSDEDQPQ